MMIDEIGKKPVVSDEVRMKELELLEKREKAELEMAKAKADADNLKGSFADELIIVVLFFPIVVTFVEVFTNEAVSSKDAWANVNSMNDNYFTLVMVVIMVVFGMRNILTKIVDKYLEKK